MTIAEQIYILVRTMPSKQASEVLLFAEFVRAKSLSRSQPLQTLDPNVTPSVSFKASLKRLHDLTQASPPIDPVALIRSGREELDERSCI